MKRLMKKLTAAVLMLAIAASLIVAVSYAWMTLSSSPTVNGIQISIGGGKTILIAPNKTEVVDGALYNYPGAFSNTIKFNQYKEYEYLNSIEGLTPVSTADGQYWFLPTYYDNNDPEVINGLAKVGDIKPVASFALDDKLEYANLTDADKAKLGSYAYLDFWIVSPGGDYDLRISRGDDETGSYLVELTSPTELDGDGNGETESYELKMDAGSVAASARVGFLVDHTTITDNTMLYYQRSPAYSQSYTKLRGNYQVPGDEILYSADYRFTIYEPNADLHPGAENGSYSITSPVAWLGGEYRTVDISDRLAIQLQNNWTKQGEINYIEEVFKAAISDKKLKSVDEAKNYFYNDYLQGQYLPYLDQGNFIQNTADFYESAVSGTVTANSDAFDAQSGATDDVCVAELEKNVPQRVRMFVWLEGQDADCVGIDGDTLFALNIELAGSQIKANEKTKQEIET